MYAKTRIFGMKICMTSGNPGHRQLNRYLVVFLRLDLALVPLLEGHVLDDVTAVAAAKDEEAGHDQAPDVEDGPGVHPEAMQELVGHAVQVILERNSAISICFVMYKKDNTVIPGANPTYNFFQSRRRFFSKRTIYVHIVHMKSTRGIVNFYMVSVVTPDRRIGSNFSTTLP
jgi:hypothetical protein